MSFIPGMNPKSCARSRCIPGGSPKRGRSMPPRRATDEALPGSSSVSSSERTYRTSACMMHFCSRYMYVYTGGHTTTNNSTDCQTLCSRLSIHLQQICRPAPPRPHETSPLAQSESVSTSGVPGAGRGSALLAFLQVHRVSSEREISRFNGVS